MPSIERCVVVSRLSSCCAALLLTMLPTAQGFAFKKDNGPSSAPALYEPYPAPSNFFSKAAEQPYSTYQMPGDGDLWPSCWADDDNLYTANGDGAAFSGSVVRPDIVVSRISGVPPQLSGTTLAKDIGTNWSGPGFNRKPTGMLCVHSTLYLAFQNLDAVGFNSAPGASIAKSKDHGLTWIWDATAPMFGGPGNQPLFTTVFFLDYGKNSKNAVDRFVYAYGLDTNWRSQQVLFLARVPADRLQSRSAWQFYTGKGSKGAAKWSSDIHDKTPVLLDTRVVHPNTPGTGCPESDSVIGQGGVVYDKPLKRYLFTSWSCSTHELYEAPAPWGPWKHVLSSDFGSTLSRYHRGQYGTSIPSKFINRDGTRLFLQSNVCCSGDSYTFSLREIYLEVSRTGRLGRRSEDSRQPSESSTRSPPFQDTAVGQVRMLANSRPDYNAHDAEELADHH